MLRLITIQNLILIDSCKLEFKKGLTIITGETGSGKTAFIQAISLCLGERGDSSLIRKGEDKAIVEAYFTDGLCIRRELVRNGKNRCFIDDEMVSLSVLQERGKNLIDVITQHENKELLSAEYHREIVDLYASIDTSAFLASFRKQKTLEEKLLELEAGLSQKEREEEFIITQLKELEATKDFKDDEEELLFEEYKKLASLNELTEKIYLILQSLDNSLKETARAKSLIDNLVRIDKVLGAPAEQLSSSLSDHKEASRFLDSYLNSLENDPKRFAYLEERLSLIAKLKRKYGNSLPEIQNFKNGLKEKLKFFETLEITLSQIKEELAQTQRETLILAQNLTQARESVSVVLQEKITLSLQELNITDALFQISLTRQPLCPSGQDHIEFYLKTNKGEPLLKVKECSSGGELSRLMLAIKTTLSEKNNTQTLIFDEIDANVGGKTASIVGEKLHSLSECRQVLCITHFPQVAIHADNHIRIYKQETDNRTIALIENLNKKAREEELARMKG